MRRSFTCIAVVLAVLVAQPAQAAEQEASTGGKLPPGVVASRDGAEIRLQEIHAKLKSMPADVREEYLGDPQRLARVIDTMLLNKQIARLAEQQGLDKSQDFAEQLELKRQDMLTAAQIDQHMAQFKTPNLEQLAHEKYLVDPEIYRPRPRVDLRHILIAVEEGAGEAEAAATAERIAERAKSGEDFGALVMEFNPPGPRGIDRSILKNADFSKLDPGFVAGTRNLREPGDVSAPARSKFGYHVIRLEAIEKFEIPAFETVKDKIVEELRSQILETERTRYLSSFANHPIEFNRELVESLLVGNSDPKTSP